MRTEPLSVAGAFLITPEMFVDDRGSFTPFLLDSELESEGPGGMFALRQGGTSVSQRGVVRGLHFTLTPPGNAKYVWCTSGRVRDYIVDIRVGSPTRGAVDIIELSGDRMQCIAVPVGVGHGFHALEDNTRMLYLMSQEYEPAIELAANMYDPSIGLALPPREQVLMSERDTRVPTLAELEGEGRLPQYERCLEIEHRIRSRNGIRATVGESS